MWCFHAQTQKEILQNSNHNQDTQVHVNALIESIKKSIEWCMCICWQESRTSKDNPRSQNLFDNFTNAAKRPATATTQDIQASCEFLATYQSKSKKVSSASVLHPFASCSSQHAKAHPRLFFVLSRARFLFLFLASNNVCFSLFTVSVTICPPETSDYTGSVLYAISGPAVGVWHAAAKHFAVT